MLDPAAFGIETITVMTSKVAEIMRVGDDIIFIDAGFANFGRLYQEWCGVAVVGYRINLGFQLNIEQSYAESV